MHIVSDVTSEVFLTLLYIAGSVAAGWAILWVGVQLVGNFLYYFGRNKDE